MPSSSSRSFWYRSTKAAPSSPGTLQTTCAVTRRGTLRWGTLIERSMGVPGGTTSAMRRESPPDPTVLVAREAISSGERISTSSSASARRWCRRSATPPCDWMLPRSCVTSSRQRCRWPSGRRSRVARFASSRISWWRGSPGSNIVRSVPPLSDPSAILPGMLELLRVRAFAIIEELEVHFEPGFNVLTGETGAVKSILVDALHLVLGGRAQADSVRTGAEEAEVQALFRPRDATVCDARLQGLGLPAAGSELVVRRTVQREGRSRAWVNGALATAAQLQAATRGLLDISGQHEHVGLLDAALHLDLLDAHAQLGELRAKFSQAFAALAEAERLRAQLDSDEWQRAQRTDWPEFQLEELDERIEVLRRIARKHGGTLATALQRRDQMRAELASLENHDEELARRQAEVQRLAAVARALAEKISEKRRSAAGAFSKAVAQELSALGMARSEISVRFEAAGEGAIAGIGPRGLETAELLLSPNPGEDLRPLSRIASGGELSRVLLAVKRVLVESDPVDAYLFDEVDAGIGGATADAVGKALAAVAKRRQVICITHLAQIAVFAGKHLTAAIEVRSEARRAVW